MAMAGFVRRVRKGFRLPHVDVAGAGYTAQGLFAMPANAARRGGGLFSLKLCGSR